MKWITTALVVLAATLIAIAAAPTRSAVAPINNDLSNNFRKALGSCVGEPAYDPFLDTNRDGCINAIDVQLCRLGSTRAGDGGGANGAGNNEVILIKDPITLANPGQTVSVRINLHNNATPLFGYSVAMRAVPSASATGSVAVNVAQTNFFPSRHLILADPGGAPLDPIFSVIQPWSGTGVFINANTADGSTVSAAPNINDMFAEVFFTASADASGVFQLQLGAATAMSDGNGVSVPFIYCGGRIAVGVTIPPVGDITGDGMVNKDDILSVITHWGPCVPNSQCISDLNCDGVVGVNDLLMVIHDWDS